MQMLAGGGLLLLAGAGHGRVARVDPSTFSTRSLLALVYLIVFGALIGYSAYVWLLRVTSSRGGLHVRVREPGGGGVPGLAAGRRGADARIVLASVVIVGGVALITLAGRRRPAAVRP
jgi:hypothetical protein